MAMVILCNKAVARTNNYSDGLTYSITIDDNDYKRAEVSVSYVSKDSIIYMTRGANQLPKRWATFVHNIEIKDSQGKSVEVKELPDAKWKVFAPLNEKLTLTYLVKLDHEDYKWSGGVDGAAYATGWGVFYTGRSIFLMNGGEGENIKVEFKLPKNWRVTTPWHAFGDTKYSYNVTTLTELAESMFFAGLHQEVSIKRDDFELVFALGGDEIIAQIEEYTKLAESVFDYYAELMGGAPNPPANNKFNKSVVIINSSTSTDGEAIGNNISILIEKNGDQMSKMISKFIFAHEFFHLWNGKSFSPASDDTEWFNEGFTNYYTLKALFHAGSLNDDAYFDVLNNLFFQRYSNDEGVGILSMSMGEAKHDHWGLIYGGGLFVGIALDMVIRKETNNEKSLDDLMIDLYHKYGGTNNHYSIKDLNNLLSTLCGKDQSEFFNNYITGVKRIPIDEYITLAGLDVKIDSGNLIIEKKAKTNQLQKNMINGLFGIKSQNGH